MNQEIKEGLDLDKIVRVVDLGFKYAVYACIIVCSLLCSIRYFNGEKDETSKEEVIRTNFIIMYENFYHKYNDYSELEKFTIDSIEKIERIRMGEYCVYFSARAKDSRDNKDFLAKIFVSGKCQIINENARIFSLDKTYPDNWQYYSNGYWYNLKERGL